VEHRFEDHAPKGWLAGTWRNADEIFCRWEFDLANRLLFVDLADQVCIESIDSEMTHDLRAALPNIALRFATKTAHDNVKSVTPASTEEVPAAERKIVPLAGRTFTTISTARRRM
jgi:hypothetical protein